MPQPRSATSWEDPDEQYWVEWTFPAVDSPSEHTYTVAYHLNNAVKPVSDSRQGIDWQVVPPDPLQPIWLATVQLNVGGDVQPDSVHLQASGAPVQSGLLGGPSAWFTAASPIASQPLVTSVDFLRPPATLCHAPTPTVAPTVPPTPTPLPTSTTGADVDQRAVRDANRRPDRGANPSCRADGCANARSADADGDPGQAVRDADRSCRGLAATHRHARARGDGHGRAHARAEPDGR